MTARDDQDPATHNGLITAALLISGTIALIAVYLQQPDEGRLIWVLIGAMVAWPPCVISIIQIIKLIRGSRGGEWSALVTVLRAHPKRFVIGAVSITVLTVTLLVWSSTSGIEFTSAVREHTDIADGETATFTVPGTPPPRGTVEITPVVTNPTGVGSCVTPARLIVTPVLDGRPGDADTVRSGHTATVRIGGAVTRASVTVTVDQSTAGDPACVVDLRIARAVMHS